MTKTFVTSDLNLPHQILRDQSIRYGIEVQRGMDFVTILLVHEDRLSGPNPLVRPMYF